VNAAFVRTPEEAATDVSLMTRAGVTRIVRFAFKLVESRPRKLLTVVTKSNAQRHAMVMRGEIAAEIAKGLADFGQDAGRRHYHAHELKPQTLDMIAVTNLHADILSDLAPALARLARYCADRQSHASAFDIMSEGVANHIWSAAMMLEHLGKTAAAARLMKALERVTANPDPHTPDLGGRADTRNVTDAVIDAIQAEERLRGEMPGEWSDTRVPAPLRRIFDAGFAAPTRKRL
jgi:tartrate dehydrogenase/decarboxylase/D-malate dehydrogenase